MDSTPDRRSFMRAIGAVTVTGAVAGCSGGESSDDSPDTGTGGDVPETVSSYLSETDNFDGSLTDETGSDAVTVDVGVEGNGGAFAFGPAAVKISTGTTVTWEWTGEGSQHNVIAEEGASFESEQTAEAEFTFEQTFEETGVVTYYCTPHESLGMKGALVVE